MCETFLSLVNRGVEKTIHLFKRYKKMVWEFFGLIVSLYVREATEYHGFSRGWMSVRTEGASSKARNVFISATGMPVGIYYFVKVKGQSMG